jgi:hypothetical protein
MWASCGGRAGSSSGRGWERRGLRYALLDVRKHSEAKPHEPLDPYSSAFALPDWQTETSIRFADVTMQVALPQTWFGRCRRLSPPRDVLRVRYALGRAASPSRTPAMPWRIEATRTTS